MSINSIKKLVVLALSIMSVTNSVAQQGVVVDKIVAIVGKQAIMLSDIEARKAQLKTQGYYVKDDIKCDIMEQLLFQKMLVNQAILDTVEVSDQDVKVYVDQELNNMITQIGSEEKLEELYGKPMHEIREDKTDEIKELMQAETMQGQITSDVSVTPQEVRDFFKSFPKDSLPIVNTEFEIEQLSVFPKIEETEILRIKDQLRDFKTRVANGEKFSTLALLYSEDGSAMKGGELGFSTRADWVPEFSAVAFNLEPNEVSKVVKTDFGYHIIQMIEKKGERVNCRHILLKPKVSVTEKRNAIAKLDSIRQKIVNKEVTFKEACWRFSDDEETRLNGGVMINRYTGTSLFEAEHLDPKVANAIRGLEVGDISKPFETEDEQGRVVCKIVLLRSKSKPHKINLSQDYQRVQNMAINDKRSKVAEEWVEKTTQSTYIKIDDDFKGCKFKNKVWNQTE